MKRILVATDGSDPAKRAVDLAMNLARVYGAQLTVAHVMAPLPMPMEGTMGPEVYKILETSRQETGEEILRAAQSHCSSAGVQCDGLLLDGQPARVISEAVDQQGADLLVVGSRGLGAFSRVFLGSTSTKLAHTCQRPILIVP